MRTVYGGADDGLRFICTVRCSGSREVMARLRREWIVPAYPF